jgi:hypothetical protein
MFWHRHMRIAERAAISGMRHERGQAGERVHLESFSMTRRPPSESLLARPARQRRITTMVGCVPNIVIRQRSSPDQADVSGDGIETSFLITQESCRPIRGRTTSVHTEPAGIPSMPEKIASPVGDFQHPRDRARHTVARFTGDLRSSPRSTRAQRMHPLATWHRRPASRAVSKGAVRFPSTR